MDLIAATLLAIMQQGSASAPPAPPPVNLCAAEEFAAFDFWVGEWDVYPTDGDTQVANSRIEKGGNGCGIAETWMPLSGPGGNSLSSYDPETGIWHQIWVGATPGRVFFEGGLVDGNMVLVGYWGQDAEGRPNLTRMTYTTADDGSVRQFGESSFDHGASWATSFDFTYRPHAE